MLLVRGDLRDRPTGLVLGALAQKYGRGELTIENHGEVYRVAFHGGTVVAASSPRSEDRLSQIALVRELVTPAAAEMIDHVIARTPHADELEVATLVGELKPESVLRLHRRAVAQRASRVISLDAGLFKFSAQTTLPIREGSEIHVGGVVFQGAVVHLSQERLEEVVGRLGSRFALAASNVAELQYLGIGSDETPIVRALLEGVALDRIAQLPGITPVRAFATVYALVACGLATASARLARGTQTPPHPTPVVEAARPSRSSVAPARPTLPPVEARPSRLNDDEAAAQAFLRGESALRAERIHDAMAELGLAVQLAPQNKRYATALAWAKFCASTDKGSAASDARKSLNRIAAYHDSPVEAHYYLGLIERMLDRPSRAEEHFREVLERMPNHVEAATELRFLARRRRN